MSDSLDATSLEEREFENEIQPKELDRINLNDGGPSEEDLKIQPDSRRLSFSKLRNRGKAFLKRILSPSMQQPRPPVIETPESISPKNFLTGYSRLKTIGEGAFGKVVLAVHERTGEYVAVKCIKKRKLISADDTLRMEREIEALKRLRHHSIIELYEVSENTKEGMIYLVLEYAARGELFDYVVSKGRLDETEARRLFRDMLNAVKHCHDEHIVHRDLKPENFLLSDDFQIKLIDFGFSRHDDVSMMHETYCGSPAYAAPEMLSRQAYRGTLADVWSLGVILYAMLCGSLPFDDTCVTKMYINIVKGDFKRPDHVSEACRDVIDSMLQIDPDKRISLSNLLHHPWIMEYIDSETYNGHIMPDRNGEVDHPFCVDYKLANELSQLMNLEPNELVNIVVGHSVGPIYATYRLMQKSRAQVSPMFFKHEESQKSNFSPRSQDSLGSRFEIISPTQRSPQSLFVNNQANEQPFVEISSPCRSSTLFPSGESLSKFSEKSEHPYFDSIPEGNETEHHSPVFEDTSDSLETSNLALQVVSGIFDVEMVSSKSPTEIMNFMILAILQFGIEFEHLSDHRLRCYAGHSQGYRDMVVFEMEICRLNSLPLNGVKFSQIIGDLSSFQSLCSLVSQTIQNLMDR